MPNYLVYMRNSTRMAIRMVMMKPSGSPVGTLRPYLEDVVEPTSSEDVAKPNRTGHRA